MIEPRRRLVPTRASARRQTIARASHAPHPTLSNALRLPRRPRPVDRNRLLRVSLDRDKKHAKSPNRKAHAILTTMFALTSSLGLPVAAKKPARSARRRPAVIRAGWTIDGVGCADERKELSLIHI